MPDWFRRGVRFLLQPEQCVACGDPLIEPRSRRMFEVFCSRECVEAWDHFRVRR